MRPYPSPGASSFLERRARVSGTVRTEAYAADPMWLWLVEGYVNADSETVEGSSLLVRPMGALDLRHGRGLVEVAAACKLVRGGSGNGDVAEVDEEDGVDDVSSGDGDGEAENDMIGLRIIWSSAGRKNVGRGRRSSAECTAK